MVKNKSAKITALTYLFYCVIFLLILIYLPVPLWHFPDGIGYYSYLPAVFKYNNYDFYPVMKSYKLSIIGINTKGFLINDFDIGYSVVCLPVYFVSQIFENETVCMLITNFFSSVLGLFSLLIIHRFLTKNLFLDKKLSLFICVCLLLGTPLLFYSYSIPQNPHTIAAFLSSIYLYLVLSLEEKQETILTYSLIGLLLGIICCIRLQRVILAIPFLIDIVIKIFRTKNFKKYFYLTSGFVGFFIIGVSPQLINSIIQFGTFTPAKIYTISLNKYLFSSIYETLFSSYHSVLLWTPLILVSVAGFVLSLKINFLFSIKMLLIFIAEIVIISLVISPGGGASFGIRYLTDLVFMFGVGLYLLIKLSPQKMVKLIIGVISLCSIWTFILFVLSTSGKIDLLEVYSTKDFFNKVLTGIQNIKINLNPRYVADSDIYIFLTLVLLFTLFISNKFSIIIKNQLSSKITFAILTSYLIVFNINLFVAGTINRVVYKKDLYDSALTQEDYQRFYTLAGIKVRLKYYYITKQKSKFDYYLGLKEKFLPKTALGKYYVNVLYNDFRPD